MQSRRRAGLIGLTRHWVKPAAVIWSGETSGRAAAKATIGMVAKEGSLRSREATE